MRVFPSMQHFKKAVLFLWIENCSYWKQRSHHRCKCHFQEWIYPWGLIQQLVSNQGKEFANTLLDQFCKLMSVKKPMVTPYHPTTNRQAERFNKDMKKHLLTILDNTTKRVAYLNQAWPQLIAVHTQFSPEQVHKVHPPLSDIPEKPKTTRYCHNTGVSTFQHVFCWCIETNASNIPIGVQTQWGSQMHLQKALQQKSEGK